MARNLSLAVIIASLFLASCLLRGLVAEGHVADSKAATCERIVSMAPSITETLFALGLGPRVVGVTRYCNYPAEALKREKIGGFYDPNYEAIFSLDPDIVIMLPEHARARKIVSSMGIRTLVVSNKTVEDIIAGIDKIGRVCGEGDRAAEITKDLSKRIERIGRLTKGLPRPSVMISISRGMATENINNVYIAGRNGFYDELLELAGGVNVYRDESVRFPLLTREGIIALNPDVVLDLVPDVEEKGLDVSSIKREWRELRGVEAVKKGRVYVLGRDYVTVPGPRFILLLEDMVRAIHPEAEEDG